MEKAVVEKLYDDLGSQYEPSYGIDHWLQMVFQKGIYPLPPNAHALHCRPGAGESVAKIDSAHHGGSTLSISLCRQQVPEGSFEVVDGVVASLSLFELELRGPRHQDSEYVRVE